MTRSTRRRRPPEETQRIGFATIATTGIAAVAVVVIVVDAVADLVRLLSTRERSFRASFWQDPDAVPYDLRPLGSVNPGEGGDPVPVADAYLRVGDLPTAAIVPAVLEILVGAAAGVVLLLLLLRFCRNLMRGVAFGRGNTRLVSAAAFTVLIGWIATSTLDGAASGPALESVGARGSRCLLGCVGSGQAAADYTPLIAFLVLAVLAVAFRVGERMQRDTEGLV
jgi:hypothetical protein